MLRSADSQNASALIFTLLLSVAELDPLILKIINRVLNL
jgi:Trp operon repressor